MCSAADACKSAERLHGHRKNTLAGLQHPLVTGTVPSLGHLRVVVKFKAEQNIKGKNRQDIYIKVTVISVISVESTAYPSPCCNFSYTFKRADIKQMERMTKGV